MILIMDRISDVVLKHPWAVILVIVLISFGSISSVFINGMEQEFDEHSFLPDIEIARASIEISEEYAGAYSISFLARSQDSDVITVDSFVEILELEKLVLQDENRTKYLDDPDVPSKNINSAPDILTQLMIISELGRSFEEMITARTEAVSNILDTSLEELSTSPFDNTTRQSVETTISGVIDQGEDEALHDLETELNSSLPLTLDSALNSMISSITENLTHAKNTLRNDLNDVDSSMVGTQEKTDEFGSRVEGVFFGQTFLGSIDADEYLVEPINDTINAGLANYLVELGMTFGNAIGMALGEAIEMSLFEFNQDLAAQLAPILEMSEDEVLALLSGGSGDPNGKADMEDDLGALLVPLQDEMNPIISNLTTSIGNAMAADLMVDLMGLSDSGDDDVITDQIQGVVDNIGYQGFLFFNGTQNQTTTSVIIDSSIDSFGDNLTGGFQPHKTTLEELLPQVIDTVDTVWNSELGGTLSTLVEATDSYGLKVKGDMAETIGQELGDSIQQMMSQFDTNEGVSEVFLIAVQSAVTFDDKITALEGGNVTLDIEGQIIPLSFDGFTDTQLKGYIQTLVLSEDPQTSFIKDALPFLFSKDLDPYSDDVSDIKAKGSIILASFDPDLFDEDGIYNGTDPDAAFGSKDELEESISDAVKDYDDIENSKNHYAAISDHVVEKEILEKTMDSTMFLMVLAIFAIIIILGIVYRNLFDLGISLLALMMAISWIYGFGTALNFTFNPITQVVPILIVGLGIDYGIHVTLRYREEIKCGESVPDSTKLMVRSVGVALLVATFTTVLAFLSNLVSPISFLGEFGMLAAVGIVGSFFCFVTFVPACKLLRDQRKRRLGKPLFKGEREATRRKNGERECETEKTSTQTGLKTLNRSIGAGATVAEKYPAVVIGVVLVITLGTGLAALNVNTEFSIEDFLPEELPLAKDIKFLIHDFNLTEGVSILIKGDITDPDLLFAIDETQDRIGGNILVKEKNGSADIESILTYMEDYATFSGVGGESDFTFNVSFSILYYQYMDDQGVPKATTTSVEIEGLYDWLYDNDPKSTKSFLHKDPDTGIYDGTVMSVSVGSTTNSDRIDKLYDQMKDDKEPIDEVADKAIITGGPILMNVITTTMNRGQTQSLFITIFASLATLSAIFYYERRSLTLGAITMLPVSLCVIWIVGAIYFMGYPFNVMTLTITSLTIGLGITYGIHITHRFLEDIDRTPGIFEAAYRTVTHTGTALFGAAITTIVGFGLIGFSLLPPMQQFGVITALTILFSFLASVFVLPTFLVMWAKYNLKHGNLTLPETIDPTDTKEQGKGRKGPKVKGASQKKKGKKKTKGKKGKKRTSSKKKGAKRRK